MSKHDIRLQFERLKKDFEYKNTLLGLSYSVKIGFRLSKFDIRPSSYVKIGIVMNVKIQYSASVRMSKKHFECRNTIFDFISNVKIRFRMSKYDIRLQFEYQNRISNIKNRYLASV